MEDGGDGGRLSVAVLLPNKVTKTQVAWGGGERGAVVEAPA